MSLAKKIALRDGERVELIVYRHPVTVAGRYFLAGLFLLVPSFFFFWLRAQGHVGEIIFVTSITLGLVFMLRAWLVHMGNIAVLTTARVVRLQRRGLFDRRVTSLALGDICDTTVRQRGIGNHLFHTGTVILRTDGGNAALVLRDVPRPAEVEQAITDQMAVEAEDSGVPVSQAVHSFIQVIPRLSPSQKQYVQAALDEARG